MQSQLGPLEINCDAPAYSIVQATWEIGIQSPEDVRWCRISHLLSEHASWRHLLHPFLWVMAPGTEQGYSEARCFCGQCLPRLEKFIFFLSTGEEKPYCLGQCGRCRTVFWEES